MLNVAVPTLAVDLGATTTRCSGFGNAYTLALAARRTDRAADDFEVRNWAGAVVGVVMAAFAGAAADPGADTLVVLDQALAHLESGLPL
ncbi:hypothetical protein [Amycolatopsis sp. lyj-346]|uniref:acyl-CoA-like ligand-binding transcription factor n=1 Tax=Amycolatopsis sp. lyj-346 TaxID=2789289 RepID=UPI003979E444